MNSIAGVGSAAEASYETRAQLLRGSGRGGQLVRLVRSANALASIKTVAAFGELFNSAYWASRPYCGDEGAIADACLALAQHLTTDDRAGVFRHLAVLMTSRAKMSGEWFLHFGSKKRLLSFVGHSRRA